MEIYPFSSKDAADIKELQDQIEKFSGGHDLKESA
jgi:hypothetical protein